MYRLFPIYFLIIINAFISCKSAVYFDMNDSSAYSDLDTETFWYDAEYVFYEDNFQYDGEVSEEFITDGEFPDDDSYVTPCIGEGGMPDSLKGEQCCQKLTPLKNTYPDGTSNCLTAENLICAYCGDGKCATGENICNCPADCTENRICKTNSECNEDKMFPEFCKKKEGFCDTEGVCEPKPRSCNDVENIVCACSLKEYQNECIAAMAGENVYFTGSCAP